MDSPDSNSLGLRRRNAASNYGQKNVIRDAALEPELSSMPFGIALALPRPSTHVLEVLRAVTRGADLLDHVRQIPQKAEAQQRCSCYCTHDIETGTDTRTSLDSHSLGGDSTCQDNSSVEDLTSIGGSSSDDSMSSPSPPPPLAPGSYPSPTAHLLASSGHSCHRCRSLTGRRLVLSLMETHACILEVDEALIDSNLPLELLESPSSRLAVSSSRNWLERLQSFIMSLQRDVEAFMQQAVRSRMLTAAQHSAVQEVAWQALIHTMVEQVEHAMGSESSTVPRTASAGGGGAGAELGRVKESGMAYHYSMTPEEAVASAVMSHLRANVEARGFKDEAVSGSCAKRRGGRLMSYRAFWAGKVAI